MKGRRKHHDFADKIHQLRGQEVMLDRDLAQFFEVTLRALRLSVARNRARFPKDAAFRLTREEFDDLSSHSVTSKRAAAGKDLPWAFAGAGILMLSSVLHSEKAVRLSVEIIRNFVELTRMSYSEGEPSALRRAWERAAATEDPQVTAVFAAIRLLAQMNGS